MKQNFPQMLRVSMLPIIIGLCSVIITGCKKEEEDQTAKFSGTWNCTATCNGGSGGSGQLVFTATDKKNITTTYSAGNGSCSKAAVLSGTASGNTITFPTTTISDNCGLSYSLNGSGTLNGNTLTFTISVNGAANGQCTFTGTK